MASRQWVTSVRFGSNRRQNLRLVIDCKDSVELKGEINELCRFLEVVLIRLWFDVNKEHHLREVVQPLQLLKLIR